MLSPMPRPEFTIANRQSFSFVNAAAIENWNAGTALVAKRPRICIAS
jgi:hypothetical protein